MKTSNLTIRLVTEHDSAELQKLNYEFNGPGLISIEEINESLKFSNEIIAITLLNEVYVGFICAQFYKSFCYRDLQGEITELYVREAYRRRGVATQLISFAEEELRSRRVRKIKVLTGNNNQFAINTYIRSEYIKDDDLVLYKRLNN